MKKSSKGLSFPSISPNRSVPSPSSSPKQRKARENDVTGRATPPNKSPLISQQGSPLITTKMPPLKAILKEQHATTVGKLSLSTIFIQSTLPTSRTKLSPKAMNEKDTTKMRPQRLNKSDYIPTSSVGCSSPVSNRASGYVAEKCPSHESFVIPQKHSLHQSFQPPSSTTSASEVSPIKQKIMKDTDVKEEALIPLPKLSITNDLLLADDVNDNIVPDDEEKKIKDEPSSISETIAGSDLAVFIASRQPTERRTRVKTLQQRNFADVANVKRMSRNTDSVLEDVMIAKHLKKRLGARRHMAPITCSKLSDFIIKHISEGSLDAVSATRPTTAKLANAADMAFRVCLEGYFENVRDEITKCKAKQIFLSSLVREDYNQGDYICRQNEVGDKLFVLEEGTVQFLIKDQILGEAQHESVFGELSLVYGIPRLSDVKAVSKWVVVWSMDALSFRRVQALIANGFLKASNLQPLQSARVTIHQRQHSSLSDAQERSHIWIPSSINFNSVTQVATVGRGTFGSVYMVSARDNETQQENYYGMKKISKASVVENKNQQRVLIEKNALQELRSSFVISLFGTYQDKTYIYFFTDFVQGGNLMSYMIKKDILSHSECVFFSANIVAGLIHVHSKGFVHRDIKPENCLIDKNGYLKLCDFGMAKRLPSIVHLPNGGTEVVTLAFTMCGTPEFMAPEFVLSTGYDKGVDWWALGCILVEMYAGRSPFEFEDLKRTFKEVCLIGMGKKKLVIPSQLQTFGLDVAQNFAQNLLTSASTRLGRLEEAEVEQHSYFSSINFTLLQTRQITAPYIPNILFPKDLPHFGTTKDHLDEEKLLHFDGDGAWCKGF